MKVQHYIGGIEGLGPVTFEKRVFVEPWEKRIFGIHVAMMALSSQLPLAATPSKFKTVWTWADLRKGAELLNPLDYFKYRYYEKWLGGISGGFMKTGTSPRRNWKKRTQQVLTNRAAAQKSGGDPAIDKRLRPIWSKATFQSATPISSRSSRRARRSLSRTRRRSSIRVCPASCVIEPALSIRFIQEPIMYLTSTGPDGVGPAMPVYCVRFDPEDIWKGNTDKNVIFYADLFEAYVGKPN